MKVAIGLPSALVVVLALTSTPGFRLAAPKSTILVITVSLLTITWRVWAFP